MSEMTVRRTTNQLAADRRELGCSIGISDDFRWTNKGAEIECEIGFVVSTVCVVCCACLVDVEIHGTPTLLVNKNSKS